MGTKRVGLARVEALIENLKRDLNLGSGGGVSLADSTTAFGYHEMYEVVSLSTSDDDDVSASLTKKLPVQARIVDAAIVAVELASNDVGSVALEIHNAAIADDAASGGTEIVGADVAGNASLPDSDLDISSNAAAGVAITMGSLAPIARGAAETHLQVTSKADMSSMQGTPKVGVYIKWFGPAAVDV
jgi:hypothetical protein